MEKRAHIITERQKKGALSSVKKSKQPKNVLIKNDIEYWPTLDEQQRESFVKFLETFCSFADNTKLISIGLESTLRNLKKQNEVQMLVIANEISPKFFGKHLIAMALHKNPNIQIIIVPKLKDVTKQLLKVSSIIFSIKRSENLTELSEFYKSLNIQTELEKYYRKICPVVDVSVKKKKVKQPPSDGPPVTLLKKPSDNSRSFVPMDAEDSSQAISKQDSSDFISLSKFTLSSSSSLSSPLVPLYRPLKIAKIVGNPNRKQKKKKIKKKC